MDHKIEFRTIRFGVISEHLGRDRVFGIKDENKQHRYALVNYAKSHEASYFVCRER
jgi:hypothetical protein